MIDHVLMRVTSYKESKEFYDALLATLGYRMLLEFGERGGYGDAKPCFWIATGREPHARTHVAFEAKDRAAVDAFYAKALELGAKSAGAPGVRPQYHASYYGAFVLDPDGHTIEAVCHQP